MQVEVIDIAASAEVPAALVSRPAETQLRQRTVAALAGILWIDGKVERLLAPGSGTFWKLDRNASVELADMRLNPSAALRFNEVLKAFKALAQPAGHLCRELR